MSEGVRPQISERVRQFSLLFACGNPFVDKILFFSDALCQGPSSRAAQAENEERRQKIGNVRTMIAVDPWTVPSYGMGRAQGTEDGPATRSGNSGYENAANQY